MRISLEFANFCACAAVPFGPVISLVGRPHDVYFVCLNFGFSGWRDLRFTGVKLALILKVGTVTPVNFVLPCWLPFREIELELLLLFGLRGTCIVCGTWVHRLPYFVVLVVTTLIWDNSVRDFETLLVMEVCSVRIVVGCTMPIRQSSHFNAFVISALMSSVQENLFLLGLWEQFALWGDSFDRLYDLCCDVFLWDVVMDSGAAVTCLLIVSVWIACFTCYERLWLINRACANQEFNVCILVCKILGLCYWLGALDGSFRFDDCVVYYDISDMEVGFKCDLLGFKYGDFEFEGCVNLFIQSGEFRGGGYFDLMLAVRCLRLAWVHVVSGVAGCGGYYFGTLFIGFGSLYNARVVYLDFMLCGVCDMETSGVDFDCLSVDCVLVRRFTHGNLYFVIVMHMSVAVVGCAAKWYLCGFEVLVTSRVVWAVRSILAAYHNYGSGTGGFDGYLRVTCALMINCAFE
eukprot:gene2681-1679_t